jgi:hypothetical protein
MGGRKIVKEKVGGEKTVDRTVDRIDKKMGDKKMGTSKRPPSQVLKIPLP